MSKDTHALILSAEMGATVVEFVILRGSKLKATRAHKKWIKDVQEQEWVKIPGELPVSVKTRTVVGVRVVEIPTAVLKSEEIQNRWAGDPQRNQWMGQFMNRAQGFGGKLEESVEEEDLLDQGYRGN